MASWLKHHIPGASKAGGPEGELPTLDHHKRSAAGLHVYDREGHVSLVLDRLPEILQVILKLRAND